MASGPFTQRWPGAEWASAAPGTQGLCADDIDAAMRYAFAADNFTGAVLVVRNGVLVAERYGPGRDRHSLVTSWSVAKSFASALMGAALDDGSLHDLNAQHVVDFLPNRYRDWRDSAKADITLRHMMTLRTALRPVNSGALYAAADHLHHSLDRQLIGTPGEKLYSYSNADVMVAGQVIAAATGMSAERYFMHRIGAAIGFTGEWWRDSVGRVMSYCCLDATPRAFARFGLLFARDGEWQGAQVVSRAWTLDSTAPARDGEYAYYWWPAEPDGFAAVGLAGQLLAVYPADDLVIARFSRYTRMGDGHPIRVDGNHHHTEEPESFDNDEFLMRMRTAL